jgi:asparagine synthase (glutamine-hydrolysing)
MHNATPAFTAASPAFADITLAGIESRQGSLAAWERALGLGALGAARAARGHFAVGMAGDDGHAFLAVDRFATQSVCFRVDGGRLRFAERADALADDPQDIDPQALYDYLYFHAIPAPRTVFRGVCRLPAGHCLDFIRGTAAVPQRYWQPTFDERPTDFSTARQRFHELLEQAVRRATEGLQVGCFLSGGTDSSTVAGMLGKVTGKPAATYSIGFDADGYDEMAYARLAARHFGANHHEYYVTPADLVRSIPDMARHNDQPFGNSSALPAYYCALKARENGHQRLLAGDGGDELFGGNSRYATQRVFSWYGALPSALRRQVFEALADRGTLDGLPLLRKVASYTRQARVPLPDRLQTYNLLGRMGRDQVLTPAFLAQVNPDGPAAQERAVWAESGDASLVNRMLAFDWRYTLAENDLPKVRAAVELAGVSVGYPMLDQDLVDFSEHLPSDYKLRRLRLRWFFKEALRGFLPDEIIRKKKQGFGLPFGVWATRDAALKALAVDSVRGLGERGVVRREFTRELVERYLPEHPGYYGSMVWILMMLEQWFRQHAPNWQLRS